MPCDPDAVREIVSMDLVGTVGPVPAELKESPTVPSPGRILDINPDPGDSFPAESFFDIYFEVTIMLSPLPADWVTLYNIDAHRMESTINEIPPDLSETPYLQPGVTKLYFFDPQFGEMHVGNLRQGVHSPEPATMLLLVAAAPIILKRRRR